MSGATSFTSVPIVDISGLSSADRAERARVADEIGKAARRPRVDPRLVRTSAGVRVEIDAVPGAADVMLALADDAAASQVAAGENKGRNLHHVAVVRSLRKVRSPDLAP